MRLKWNLDRVGDGGEWEVGKESGRRWDYQEVNQGEGYIQVFTVVFLVPQFLYVYLR